MIIHIGMHKCASTSLQQLISNSKQYGLVQFYDKKFSHIENIFTRFFMSNIEDPRDIVLLKEFFADKSVLSSEGLCGQLFDIYSGFYLNIYPKKLLKIIPKIEQINLILRDPIELLFSMYKNDIQMGAQVSPEEWIKVLKSRNWTTLINPRAIFNSYSTVCKVFRVFEFKDIIKMSPKELDNHLFNGLLRIGSITSDLHKANVGQSYFSTNIQRILINQFFKTKLTKLHHIGKANAPINNFYRYNFSKLVNQLTTKKYERQSYENFSNIVKQQLSDELKDFYLFMTEYGSIYA